MADTKNFDDVMLAMDVVDTLRHRVRVAEKELSDEGREQALIKRLREIYEAQGIEVPDVILQDGVKALEEKRFAFEPAPQNFQTRLAKIYVQRAKWGRPLTFFIVLCGLLIAFYYALFIQPQQKRVSQIKQEITQTIPAELDRLFLIATELAATEDLKQNVRLIYDDAKAAVSSGDIEAARDTLAGLQLVEQRLRQAYSIRIISRPGEYSGVFRIPDESSDARNYYLIVEAIASDGSVLAVQIESEEDQKRSVVKKWGLRVPKDAFDAVAADKSDDQIIQRAVIGQKTRGYLKPDYHIEGVGGAILEW